MGDVHTRKANHNKLIGFLNLVKAHSTTPLTFYQASALLARGKDVMEKTEVIQNKLLQACADDNAATIQESALSPNEATFQEFILTFQELIGNLPKYTSTAVPAFKEFTEFVARHVRGLMASTATSSHTEKKSKPVRCHHSASEPTCQICKQPHPNFKCKELTSKSLSERITLVRHHHIYFNCLSKGHSKNQCSSKRTCQKCGRKHHTLLHSEEFQQQQAGGSHQGTSNSGQQPHIPHPQPQGGSSSNHAAANTQVLLSTAVVQVRDVRGQLQPVRVFFDQGSQPTLISEECVSRLGYRRQPSNLIVSGVGESKVGRARGKVDVILQSQYDEANQYTIEAHVFRKVTGELPRYVCHHTNWGHLHGLQLADPRWFQPGRVDILVGGEYYTKVLVKGDSTLITNPVNPTQGPDAQKTIFGWILSGLVPVSGHIARCFHMRSNRNEDAVADLIKRFWEVEQPPHPRFLTKEESQCEDHFTNSTFRDPTGRYVTSVPFNSKKSDLGLSREGAVRRLHQVEKRLMKNPDMRRQYLEFMREYQQLGHLETIPQSELKEVPGKTYYLPHHCVVNQSSSTTKLRVVFDGSAKTTNGVSLNDAMLVGPTVQDDLYDQLIRFRLFPIVLKADITKMYRQFRLIPADSDFHRIVWRESPDQPVVDLRLLTVTYGTACAPYLATRCLKQLGMEVENRYPLASAAIINHHYVDDLMSGGNHDSTVIRLYHELNKAVREAGMELRKFSSNSTVVLEAIPEDQREVNPHDFDPDKTVKALGVQWNPVVDHFMFKYVQLPVSATLTKRKLLSDLAKVFDPLGLIAPVILQAKILLQELWKLSLDWDHPVPVHIQQQWMEYQDELKEISRISIPRCILFSKSSGTETNPEVSFQLHGFSDASETAYGAVVYLRTSTEEGDITVRLLTSKTKVAPLQQVPLPRLELMAAVLLSELVDHLITRLEIKCDIYLWSDSTITLRWISSPPRRWKTFIANRVSRIQECTKLESWRHVPGVENPADLASRGVPVSQLIDNSFWWNGPQWLSEPQLPTFYQENKIMDNSLLEERTVPELSCQVVVEKSILDRFSTVTRTKRVTAYVLRFIHNSKPANRQQRSLQPHPHPRCGSTACGSHSICSLTPLELQYALMVWIKQIQHTHFGNDIMSLQSSGKVTPSSKISSLSPYVDAQGILRVSGRLQNSNLSEEGMHQTILPGDSHLTMLIIHHVHQKQLHSGFQSTWSAIQREYWILRGRDQVRFFIRRCVICRRFRAEAAEQLMGNLPSSRVTPTCRPFVNTGVDYAGPFYLKNPVGRAPKLYKGYMCIFVCMVTKAIHLEAVSSLSTEAFIATFRRFVARRGLCAHMFSDRGTNFIGADKELSLLVKSTSWNTAVTDNLSTSGITWHFNEPFSPHQGGLWEAGVKSAKFHLRRVMGQSNLTFEQFSTVLCQVEAILNSRPLYQSSSDPTDSQALTPGHFIIGEPLTAVPDANLSLIQPNRQDVFQKQQHRIQQFWQRWSREYLNTLQQRTKWKVERDNLQPGDLVLIIEDNLPPGKWVMGRVVNGHKDSKGTVRKVSIAISSSNDRNRRGIAIQPHVIERHICKLVPLLKCNTTE